MASIKYTGIVHGIKGSLAGTIFQGGHAGNIMRSKMQNVKKQVPFLQSSLGYTSQSVYQYLSQQWRTLTDVQRASWATAAPSFPYTNRWGDTYTPSSFNLFMSLNVNLVLSGIAYVPTAPTPYTFLSFTFDSVSTITATTMQLNFDCETDSNCRIEVRSCASTSKGSKSPRGGGKFITYRACNAGATPNVIDEYVARFGAPLNASKIYFAARLVNRVSGQFTAWQLKGGITSIS